jgi:acetyl-CoA carboxylase carboxyl transferase subunit alpha
MKSLEFEKPLDDLYSKIDELKQLSDESNIDLSKDIKTIESRAEKMKKEIYKSLTPSQIIQIARHPNRPTTLSLAQLMCEEFTELKGDRTFRDDPSIVGGIAKLGPYRIMIIGHQKGADTKEKIKRNFGMPHPEGYRKALRLMKLAEKFDMPIITLIDTPGAYPGKEAEERGQAEAIARNLKEMIGISVPIISIVIGEGGSGGALGIAVCNTMFMLEYAVYSVISPEGCASILFRDASRANYAAEKLKITSKDIVSLGICDRILPEPLGGAHNDWSQVSSTIKDALIKEVKSLLKDSPTSLKEHRYSKFRSFGKFHDSAATKSTVNEKK